ncbi:cation diffusion facilitator family transporter [Muribaculum intestinale]|mgnify:CR=1 FL=1|uniref:cation diffusion facilitator family transporter n=1 Tax=Muribaculum intestinale TaxID=1796646 RepID=UPI0026EACFF7|nr:cation diffusion facilitator family transporter [Muribaculum intestinale]
MTESLSTGKELSLIRKVTMVGFWINAALVIIKLFFGYWGNSDALVADGYHSLSDFITDFMVLYFVGVAYKKADSSHPYGHGKYETIGSFFIAIVLMLVAVGIGWGGITSIIGALNGHEIPRPDVWTIVVAGVSIAAKEFCYRYTMVYARKIGSSALKANAWHHRTDAISSVATIIGVSLAYALGDSWRIMDPIASIVIAVFIGISAIQIAKPSIGELLEVSLPIAQINNINNIIRSVNGVRRVHNLRARRNGHAIIVDVNVHVDPDITIREGHAIATDVEEGLRESYGHNIIIYVHVEPDEGHPEC